MNVTTSLTLVLSFILRKNCINLIQKQTLSGFPLNYTFINFILISVILSNTKKIRLLMYNWSFSSKYLQLLRMWYLSYIQLIRNKINNELRWIRSQTFNTFLLHYPMDRRCIFLLWFEFSEKYSDKKLW